MAKKEYIEREAVIQLIKTEGSDGDYNLGAKADNEWFCAEAKRIPAADVVEVRHGRWVEVEVKELAYYKMMIASMRCDQCKRYHNEVYHYGNPTEMAKHCGFCGARMDGGVNDV